MLAAHLLQLVAQLDNNAEHIAQCESAVKKVFTALCDSEDASSSPSDAAIVSSMPGVGPVVVAAGSLQGLVTSTDLIRFLWDQFG